MGGDNTGQRGGRKLVSLKGVVMVDTVRGVLRIRKWPKKRPTRSAAQLAAEDKFRQANILYRYLDPRQQIVYMEASKGTPFYPRDLFVANVYGRGPGWRDPNTGVKYLSMPLMIDVSDSLDVFTQTEGGILVRGEKYWEALSPGTAGFVLTSNGPGSKPSFQAGGGGATAHGARAYLSSNWAFGGGAIRQITAWDVEGFDTDGLWNAGSNPERFTIPAGFSYANAHLQISDQNSFTGQFNAIIRHYDETSTLIETASSEGDTAGGDSIITSTGLTAVGEGHYFVSEVFSTTNRTLQGGSPYTNNYSVQLF